MSFNPINQQITAPVTFEDAQKAFGTSAKDLSVLCTMPNINPWARYKPIAVNGAILPLTEQQVTGANFGLNVSASQITVGSSNQEIWDGSSYTYFSYIKPNGNMAAPWRLSDFANARTVSYVGYNHLAKCPVSFNDVYDWDVKYFPDIGSFTFVPNLRLSTSDKTLGDGKNIEIGINELSTALGATFGACRIGLFYLNASGQPRAVASEYTLGQFDLNIANAPFIRISQALNANFFNELDALSVGGELQVMPFLTTSTKLTIDTGNNPLSGIGVSYYFPRGNRFKIKKVSSPASIIVRLLNFSIVDTTPSRRAYFGGTGEPSGVTTYENSTAKQSTSADYDGDPYVELLLRAELKNINTGTGSASITITHLSFNNENASDCVVATTWDGIGNNTSINIPNGTSVTRYLRATIKAAFLGNLPIGSVNSNAWAEFRIVAKNSATVELPDPTTIVIRRN